MGRIKIGFDILNGTFFNTYLLPVVKCVVGVDCQINSVVSNGVKYGSSNITTYLKNQRKISFEKRFKEENKRMETSFSFRRWCF